MDSLAIIQIIQKINKEIKNKLVKPTDTKQPDFLMQIRGEKPYPNIFAVLKKGRSANSPNFAQLWLTPDGSGVIIGTYLGGSNRELPDKRVVAVFLITKLEDITNNIIESLIELYDGMDDLETWVLKKQKI